MIRDSLEQGRMLVLNAGEYDIETPIDAVLSENVTEPFGIISQGAKLVSRLGPEQTVMKITSCATVRFLKLDGVRILGNGNESHGIHIYCAGKSDAVESYMYNFTLRDCVVEHCGGDGVRLEGNVFEGSLRNCFVRDNHGCGLWAGNSEGGVLSAIRVRDGVYGQNHVHGIVLENGARDLVIDGAYVLMNGNYGINAPNGVHTIRDCGFENNWTKGVPFQEAIDNGIVQAAIGLQVGGSILQCTATSNDRQTHLLKHYAVGGTTIMDSGAEPQPSTAAMMNGVITVDADNNSIILMNSGAGDRWSFGPGANVVWIGTP